MEDIDLTLFLGGTRSGKSALAEALVTAKARGPVWYLATARPLGDDPAMAERIRRHRSRRPAHWHTLECPRHPGRELAPLLAAQAADAPVPTILLDCVTLWMSNILFALDDPQDAAAFETSLTEEVGELLHTMRAFPCRWVLVSGETGLGGIRAERLARVFDDGLGLANQMLHRHGRPSLWWPDAACGWKSWNFEPRPSGSLKPSCTVPLPLRTPKQKTRPFLHGKSASFCFHAAGNRQARRLLFPRNTGGIKKAGARLLPATGRHP